MDGTMAKIRVHLNALIDALRPLGKRNAEITLMYWISWGPKPYVSEITLIWGPQI